jgi:protoheme IX farnesyltransferase
MKDFRVSLETVKAYYSLTKPGIIRGNVMTAVAGFLFASKGSVDSILLSATLLGVTLTIASGCIFNNYTDRFIDAKMERTKNRALVTGAISPLHALVFASLLGILGIGTLLLFTNVLTTFIGMLAFFSYVVLYGYAKRASAHGTLVGSLPGALSLVAGYTAVANQIDITALLLFAIMATWQMPHFYAIAIYRIKEYRAAGLPILSIKKGLATTKKQIIVYIVAFGGATMLLSIFSFAGKVYVLTMLALTLYWLWYALKGFKTKNVDGWAKGVFGISLLTLLIFSILISVNNFLP